MDDDQIEHLYADAIARWGPQNGRDIAHDAWVRALEGFDPERGTLYSRVRFGIYQRGRIKPSREDLAVDEMPEETVPFVEPDFELQRFRKLAQEFGESLPSPDREIWFTHLATMDVRRSKRPSRKSTSYQYTSRGRFKVISEATGQPAKTVSRVVTKTDKAFVAHARREFLSALKVDIG